MHGHTADAAAIRLLRSQHGLARVSQLHTLGLSRSQVDRRVARGVFERVGHGVVSLTPADDSRAARAMAAVLLSGDGAATCLWTAAMLHRLDAPRDTDVHVVREGQRRRTSEAGIKLHRTRWLPNDHVTTINGIPTTSIPRTLVDCARLLDSWSTLAMLDSVAPSAAVWATIHHVSTLLSNGRAGVRTLAAVTAPDGAPRFRSALERRAAEALAAHGVPEGEWNVVVTDDTGRIREVDLVFREQRLVIEFDGLAYHDRADRADRDRRADRRLQIAGWRVLRFTWRDVIHHPAKVAREVMLALQI